MWHLILESGLPLRCSGSMVMHLIEATCTMHKGLYGRSDRANPAYLQLAQPSDRLPELPMPQPKKTFSCGLIAMFAFALSGMAVSNSVVGLAADNDEETTIAKSLAAMVSAGLAVISKNQDHIDNPNIADKG